MRCNHVIYSAGQMVPVFAGGRECRAAVPFCRPKFFKFLAIGFNKHPAKKWLPEVTQIFSDQL